jgi:hypothetical protein
LAEPWKSTENSSLTVRKLLIIQLKALKMFTICGVSNTHTQIKIAHPKWFPQKS